MDGYLLLFTALKILVVILFVVNTAAILTWGERRQSAMIQDRIGPNRAVIYVPGWIVKVLALGVGFGLAAAAGAYAFAASRRPEAVRLDAGFMLTELAILVGWLGLVIVRGHAVKSGATQGLGGALRKIADARLIFYSGLAAHLAVGLARASANDADPGPASTLFRMGSGLAVLLLAAAGVGAFMRVPSGRVGIRLFGTLHALADGAKMAFKEDFIPPNADRLLHSLGPLIALFPAFVVFAVVPFGDTLCVHVEHSGNFWTDLVHAHIGQITSTGFSAVVPRYGICADGAVPLQVANLSVGILYMFAMAGTGIIGAAIAGWSSDNKFSLLGGLRASSQMVSYEVAMGLSLVGAFMTYNSVRLDDMVRWQGDHAWGIFVQPFAFVLFLAASIAENKRVPFDAPEGESEIVAGYFLEYSGMKFGMFMLGEYMELAISSAVLVTIFFGGYSIPFLHRDGITVEIGDTVFYHLRMAHTGVILLGVVAFFAKTWLVCWAQLFIRWTIPRFRYDQIMKLGWRFLLPSALVNMLVTALVLLAIAQGGPGLSNALDVVSDLTQVLVVLAGTAGILGLISALLAPRRAHERAVSSSATFAAAKGGTKTSPMQA